MERSDCLLIALGANLPQDGTPPIGTLTHAIAALQQAGLSDLSVSRFFATPCFPPGAGPDYVNAALIARAPAAWDAAHILAMLHDIEHRFGRKRETRWGMRDRPSCRTGRAFWRGMILTLTCKARPPPTA
jgi:2-amino-4-hydroxy-6-hydroxymethyldihydropteridine diphosphokinase